MVWYLGAQTFQPDSLVLNLCPITYELLLIGSFLSSLCLSFLIYEMELNIVCLIGLKGFSELVLIKHLEEA